MAGANACSRSSPQLSTNSFMCISSFNPHNNPLRCRPCYSHFIAKEIKKLSILIKSIQQSSLAVYYNIRYVRARLKDKFGWAGGVEAYAWSLDSNTDVAT